MTSNLGSEYILKAKGNLNEDVKQDVMKVVKRHFKPEFLNRLDDMVVFNTLTKEQLNNIIDIHISNMEKRLENRNIKLNLDNKVRQYIIDNSYDPIYGARPLKRYIEKQLGTAIGRYILRGDLESNAIIKVTIVEDTFSFSLDKFDSPQMDRKQFSGSPGPSISIIEDDIDNDINNGVQIMEVDSE